MAGAGAAARQTFLARAWQAGFAAGRCSSCCAACAGPSSTAERTPGKGRGLPASPTAANTPGIIQGQRKTAARFLTRSATCWRWRLARRPHAAKNTQRPQRPCARSCSKEDVEFSGLRIGLAALRMPRRVGHGCGAQRRSATPSTARQAQPLNPAARAGRALELSCGASAWAFPSGARGARPER